VKLCYYSTIDARGGKGNGMVDGNIYDIYIDEAKAKEKGLEETARSRISGYPSS